MHHGISDNDVKAELECMGVKQESDTKPDDTYVREEITYKKIEVKLELDSTEAKYDSTNFPVGLSVQNKFNECEVNTVKGYFKPELGFEVGDTIYAATYNDHPREKPFKCDHCGRCFSQQSDLKTHIRTHTGGKPFKCEYCSKCFSQQSDLKTHIRTHTGEKPFKCDHCSKCFSQQSHLKNHIMTHTGEKPFKCDHCSKYFSRQSLLTIYIRTHTGEKPFKCEYCGKCFSQQSHLKTHIRRHTGEKLFKCEHCEKSFSLSRSWKNHLRTHEREKLNDSKTPRLIAPKPNISKLNISSTSIFFKPHMHCFHLI